MANMVNKLELVGVQEIAKLANVSRQHVYNWKKTPYIIENTNAKVAELADAPDLGSGG